MIIQIWTSLFKSRTCLAVLFLAVSAAGYSAELKYVVSGVADPLLTNVQNHVQAFSIERQSDISEADYESLLADAIEKAESALRPYGYYKPEISGRVLPKNNDDTVVEISVIAGPPIVVDQLHIELTGEGAARSLLTSWRNSWPLTNGQVLDQTVWEERKQYALDTADSLGYLAAEYVEHKVEVDLDSNQADITLILDTGRRYMFGEIDYGEHVLKPGIVEYIPRFETGEPFSRYVLDKFRLDLWKTGYFTEVVVEEVPRTDVSPPAVDLVVQLETTTRNTYQGSIGIGSDTGMRIQGQWSKHPVSSNGERLDIGAGWQEQDDEFSIRGSYRLPRRNRSREYWTSDVIAKHESLDLEVRRSPDDDFIRIANGTVDEFHLRLGRLKVRNFKSGEQQAFETFFVQGLIAKDEFKPLEEVIELLALGNNSDAQDLLEGSDETISFGFDYDLVAVYGKGWETKGHRERAWAFASSKSFGSDRDFLQAYLSTRRSYLKGDRWKFIVRAEVGYTDASVDNYSLDLGGDPLPLSVTTLPNFYRFKAGGSSSVRGYGFEELSNNHIGSNHIVSASAEVEMKFLENWSAALFFDIGNAFNDWENPELKKGVGVGIRWYSFAGPIRVDFANGLDLQGRPWRVHFTIGTPLL